MSAHLFARGLRNDGDWVGVATHLPHLELHGGDWVHLTATDPAAAGRALALLAGTLRLSAGELHYRVDDQCWMAHTGSARQWARLRREAVHHAGGYLAVAPSEPVAEAVSRLTGTDGPTADDLLHRHGLHRLAERRWGELAGDSRHRVSLVLGLAMPQPILLLNGLERPSVIEHAAERAAAGDVLVSAGDPPEPHPSARSVHLPDEGIP